MLNAFTLAQSHYRWLAYPELEGSLHIKNYRVPQSFIQSGDLTSPGVIFFQHLIFENMATIFI